MSRHFTSKASEKVPAPSIEVLLDHWDHCVQVRIKPYAYESFVRVNDHIKGFSPEKRDAFLNHPSLFVCNIAKDIKEHGEASYSLFKTMWESHLTATPTHTPEGRTLKIV